MSFDIWRLIRAAAVLAAITVLTAATTRDAHASAGCDAVNAGGFSVSTGDQGGNDLKTISGFVAGDTVQFTVTLRGGDWLLSTGSNVAVWSVAVNLSLYTENVSYQVTGNYSDTTLTERIEAKARTAVTATCTAAPTR